MANVVKYLLLFVLTASFVNGRIIKISFARYLYGMPFNYYVGNYRKTDL